jgi:hypothetical protein
MGTFGKWALFPITFGGGTSVAETIANAMYAALEPGYDVSDPLIKAEIDGQAIIVANIWAVNERLKAEALPGSMQDNLVMYETAMGITISDEDTEIGRRKRVAARLAGLVANTVWDMERAAQKLAGVQFVEIRTPLPEHCFNYWPGGTPGPPGMPWASGRARLAVQLRRDGLPTDEAFFRLVNDTEVLLDAMAPIWMQVFVVEGEGTAVDDFVCDLSVCEEL